MPVIDSIIGEDRTAFSFEVLPPLKGTGMKSVFSTIDILKEFNPLYINITTHRSEVTYTELPDGRFERRSVKRRPGTAAVAAAIHYRYDIPVVPHVLCSGYSKAETEYFLLDLQYLGITDILVLRGDKAKDMPRFVANKDGWSHAIELQGQVNDFNQGVFVDGSQIKDPVAPFHYGVAGYPEKHDEAPNPETDLYWLKKKVEAGADYVVTQMFFDNRKYLDFVDRARQAGITVPIIPGIKPFSKLSQLNVLPKTFGVDIPQELVSEALKCKNDDEAKELGVEWCVAQCRELMEHKVPSIHFYAMSAAESIRRIAAQVY